MNPETLKRILNLRFSENENGRVAELAERSTAGTLTPDEAAEYDDLIQVADILALLQSKARRMLKELGNDDVST